MKKRNSETDLLIKALKLSEVCEDTPPKGWVCLSELSKQTGCSRSYLGKRVGDGVSKGIIEKRLFRVKVDGIPRVVPYYKTKKRSSDSVASKSGN